VTKKQLWELLILAALTAALLMKLLFQLR